MNEQIKEFFITEYTNNMNELRAKASNPRARKSAEWAAKANELELIINELRGTE